MAGRETGVTEPGDFISNGSKRAYAQWCVIALLAFLTTASLSYLSVILGRMGFSKPDMAIILSVWSIPVIPSSLVAGALIRRFGAERVVVAGLMLTLAGFCALGVVGSSRAAAILARMTQGAGFGLIAPSMMVAVKSHLGGRSETYFLGVFSAMMVVPQLVSPAFAEWYVSAHPLPGFFAIAAVPLCLALALSVRLAGMSEHKSMPSADGYLRLLKDRGIRPALVAILVTGLGWGFVSTLLALLVRERGLQVAWFFTTFGATMLVTRFFLMRKIDAVAPRAAVATALGLMGLSLAIASVSTLNIGLAASAVVFAIGYGIAFPRTIVWAANRYQVGERAKPIALINASFNVGGLLAPLLGGFLIEVTTVSELAGLAAAVAFATAAFLTLSQDREVSPATMRG